MTLTSQKYHQLTSYQRNQMQHYSLDWINQPSTFKRYPNIELIPLPREVQHNNEKLSNILKRSCKKDDAASLDIADLSRILSLAYSITGKASYGDGYHYYRSVASAGALYPVEIYVATHDVKDLQNGLYHFSIAEHGLVALRSEDISGWVADYLNEPSEKHPLLTFFFTAIFFRSAWKYRKRAYRYHLLDTGHLIENMGVALKALGLNFCLSYDFDDRAVNQMLGLDETREVCLAVCQVPGPDILERGDKKKDIVKLTDSIKRASRVSNKEVEYPVIGDIHMAGGIKVPAARPAAPPTLDPVCTSGGGTIKIKSSAPWPEKINCEDTFLLRRSQRNFIPTLLSRKHIMALLEFLTMTHRIISPENEYQNSVRTGFITGKVEGFEPGFYLTDELESSFKMVDSGSFTGLMASICLDQKWLTNASVHFLFITDLKKLEQYYGPRSYRYAMLQSGRLGERLYLAATAMGLRCCGIGAFYDKEAARLLKLKAGSKLLYLVAVGLVKQKT